MTPSEIEREVIHNAAAQKTHEAICAVNQASILARLTRIEMAIMAILASVGGGMSTLIVWLWNTKVTLIVAGH